MRRVPTVLALAAGMALAAPGVALAQEPPVGNCDPFSCLFVIPIGPFGPFEFVIFPNGLGSPPAPTP